MSVVEPASVEIAVRLPEPLLNDVDALVTSGSFSSRGEAVQAGLEALTKLEAARRIDSAIVAGYTDMPQSETDEKIATAALRASILEEPW